MKIPHQKRCLTVVDYYEIERLISSLVGFDWSFVADQECSNDSDHEFTISDNVPDWEWDTIRKMIGDEKLYNYSAQGLLNLACKMGHLEPGDYLIKVCW